jgi:hypothetical protein
MKMEVCALGVERGRRLRIEQNEINLAISGNLDCVAKDCLLHDLL